MSVQPAPRGRRRRRLRWGQGRQQATRVAPARAGEAGGARGLRWFWVALLGLVLLVGHYLYWYSPRPRQTTLKPRSLAAYLLAGDDYQACLWLAYPHQNLAMLADEVGNADRYLAAVAEVTGLRRMEVPRFGPFRAPPAREIVIASADGGERFVVAARIYPGVALVARLAGKIASNPWLAGGDVELSGRSAQVSWRHGLWLLEPRDAEPIVVRLQPDSAAKSEPAFSRLHLPRPSGLLPAGTYRLTRLGGGAERAEGAEGVELIGAGDWHPPELAELLPAGAVAVLFASAAQQGLAHSTTRGAQAGLLADRGDNSSLPGVAVLSRPGGKRWKLPGEKILHRLRGDLPTAEVAGWRLRAFDPESLRVAGEVATRLAPLAEAGANAPARVLWANPGPAAQLVDDLATTIEAIPFVGASRSKRWRAWAIVLEPWAHYDRLTVAIGHENDQMRWRLER